MTGAFQGAMPTQHARRLAQRHGERAGLVGGMTSPPIWVVIAAASRSMLAASITLKPVQGAVAPVSAIAVAMNSPSWRRARRRP